ncbi:MAG TPA: response regulator [Candidatus Paceibacterota bacterium]
MRILLVDDNDIDRRVYGGCLVRRGHEVAFATSGEEAITKAKEGLPDVVILDLQMPGMGGFAALSAISKSSKPPRLWLHSHTMDDNLVKAAKALGAENAFPKGHFLDEVGKLSS